MVKVDLEKQPHENCPSFVKCNTNKCPLHKDYFRLKDTTEDKKTRSWRKCRASKSVRMEIAKAFKIKHLGLFPRELDSIRKSIQMKKQVLGTRENNINTPQISEEMGDEDDI